MGNLYEYVKMAVHNIMANKGRSFLTMLGIIIGIASVRFDARLVFGELADLLAGLHGQFPGGGEDQHLDMLFFWVDPFHSRDAEGSGLAGAGVGAADDIPPGQN